MQLSMLTLFPEETRYPAGFTYEEGFITTEEENLLTAHIKTIALHPMQFRGYEAKRKVASFGWDWSFEQRELKKGQEIPAAFHWLIARVAHRLAIPADKIGELLLTEYPIGSVINWHRDAPPFDIIAGISLQADCVFKLRPHNTQKQGRKSTISIPVKPRSLYIIANEARSEWEHSTAPVQQVRYSITLRTLVQHT
jgi:alkylated DNA repair dioxygenase AlkB